MSLPSCFLLWPPTSPPGRCQGVAQTQLAAHAHSAEARYRVVQFKFADIIHLMLCAGCVSSKMDRLAAGKRVERICARSLSRAAWSAMAAYSKASILGFKLTNRVSKMRCASALHLLVRFQQLGSSIERIKDRNTMGYVRWVFSLFRLNRDMASVLVHRADSFHQSVISRSLTAILTQWKNILTLKSRIQASCHAALRRWMLLAAAKTFSAWQSLTLISCSNRDTAIKWRFSCDRRRFLAQWAEITRHHKRIKTTSTQIWMRNDSRTAMIFFAVWKSVAETSLIAFKKFKGKWSLYFSSAVFDRWCTAAGSLTALRLFSIGCNHSLCRRMFLDWRAAPHDTARKLHRAARSHMHFLQKKCIRLWKIAAICKGQGRAALGQIFVQGWCTRLLVFFFSNFRSRVRGVKIEARISYYRCIAYQAALAAWKANVFDEIEAAGVSSPVHALRQSTAKRLWTHQFPPKSPTKLLRLSQERIEQARSSRNQLIDFENISNMIRQSSGTRLSRAFISWLSVLSEIQARRRVRTAAMHWHSSVYIRNILKHAFDTLMTFAARSRARLTIKFNKCTQQYALKQKGAVLKVWKHTSSTLRHISLKVSSFRKTILIALLNVTFRKWLHWSQNMRVRTGYLRRVVEPCIEDSASRRLLACCRQAFGSWRQFLIPKRLSQRFARRCLLKGIGKLLIQWHHVALCTVDDRVADAIAGSTMPVMIISLLFTSV